MLWASTSGTLINSLDAPFEAEHSCFAQIAAYAPSGQEVALSTCCLYCGFPEVWLWGPDSGAARHTALVGSTGNASACQCSCAYSPCSSMLLCHLGSCVVILDVQSLQIVQRITDVPGPAVTCLWGLMGAAVLVEAHQPGSTACSGIQLLPCCSSGLEVGEYLSPAASKLQSGMCAWTDAGTYLVVLAGTASSHKLIADFEPTIISFTSAKAVSYRLGWMPCWLYHAVDNTVLVLCNDAGEQHLALSFS